ncbi:MAG: metalloregulator ArsR/SmtB family transcription factor [Coriobacteriia bacterium]|nr:metalloregulator ArsR/SmtB family transcription factor [Coriobacteriia bacterium]
MDQSFFCMHTELCKTLANEKRQMILAALRDSEMTVGELVEMTGIPQATLSQHLSKMRAHDVVRVRRSGAYAYYSLANPKLIQAFDLITEVMQESALSRASASETESEEDAR